MSNIQRYEAVLGKPINNLESQQYFCEFLVEGYAYTVFQVGYPLPNYWMHRQSKRFLSTEDILEEAGDKLRDLIIFKLDLFV